MRRFTLFGIVLLACSLLLGMPTTVVSDSDQSLTGSDNILTERDKTEKVYISGLPAIVLSEQDKIDFLEKIDWKNLPPDTPKRGLIHGFSCDEENDRCVIAINHIFVFEKGKCKTCYSFNSEGSYTLFSERNDFYILFKRGKLILQFNENRVIALYELIQKELGSGEYDKMHNLNLIGTNKSVQHANYTITNRHPSITPHISAAYDTLIWKNQTIYETSFRLYAIITVVIINIIAVFILVRNLKQRVSRRCQGTCQGDGSLDNSR